VTVAESDPEAHTRSVCIIRTTADNISTDIKCSVGPSTTAEPLVNFCTPNHIFGIDEARHLTSCVQSDAVDYWCTL